MHENPITALRDHAIIADRLSENIDKLILLIQEPLSESTTRRRYETHQEIVDAFCFARDEFGIRESCCVPEAEVVTGGIINTDTLSGDFVDYVRSLGFELLKMRSRQYKDGLSDREGDSSQIQELRLIARGLREFRLWVECRLTSHSRRKCEMKLLSERERRFLLDEEHKDLDRIASAQQAWQGWFDRLDIMLEDLFGSPEKSTEIPDMVTLLQVAPLVGKQKRTLERWRESDKTFPTPDVRGVSGTANEWRWKKLRPYLEVKSSRPLPVIFPAHARG